MKTSSDEQKAREKRRQAQEKLRDSSNHIWGQLHPIEGRLSDETKEHINICRMQDCRLRAVCKTPILHTARSTQADGDDIKMHADWCKKFVNGH